MKLWKTSVAALFALTLSLVPAAIADGQEVTTSWAIAEFGEPLYDETMAHWPYANPDAPKGGKIVLGAFGSFDSLNTLILKGEWPRSLVLTSVWLMSPSADELASGYGEVASSVELPADKSWAIFNLRPEARYHDGVPITAGDFVYGLEVLKEHGRPFLRSFFEEVERAEALSDHRLKYHFKTRNNMKPVMVVATASAPVPRHYWADRDITETTLEPPLAAGPYKIVDVDPGRSITYQRVEDFWGADLPVNRGLNNFDEIRYEYYRDDTVRFEAFKAGKVDFRSEGRVQRWKTGYDFEGVKNGHVVTRELTNNNPRGMGGFFFNTRREKFKDPRVREAIVYLYDFEAVQRTLLYGEYKRIGTYFPNSDFGASGPPKPEEIAVLEPFEDQVLPSVLTEVFAPPTTDGSGRARQSLRSALRLFKAAGYEVKEGKLVNVGSGEQLQVQIVTGSPEVERLSTGFIENMRRAGIDASLRLVESSQWEVIGDEFDFDLMTSWLNFFPPPGPELRSYFGSAAADFRGSANMVGIKDPVVDQLIEQIFNAEDLESLKVTTRALDRVLLWRHYVVPLYYPDEVWIAYWNKFAYPERAPRYAVGFPSAWWIDTDLAAGLPQ